jgi:hypothetical protein
VRNEHAVSDGDSAHAAGVPVRVSGFNAEAANFIVRRFKDVAWRQVKSRREKPLP